jgi:4-hydroxy-tetrahydrodipicolinate reductase
MTINVIVNGAKGKMGSECVRAVLADAELHLVGQVDVGDDLAGLIKATSAQVVVDFTHPSVAYENVLKIIGAGARPVIGTTGFTVAQIDEIKKLSREKKLGGLIAPNFSIGAVLMMKFAAEAARYLPQVEIIEKHHDNKADAPSGTAIQTAEKIVAAQKILGPKVKSKETIAGSLGGDYQNIRIHSIRLPGFVADQDVILGGLGQRLTISHETIDRAAFMPGVVLACKKVISIHELVYGLENLL